MTVGDRLFTLTAKGAIAEPTQPGADALLGDLKDALDRYASRWGELADREWNRCNEFQPALKACGQ